MITFPCERVNTTAFAWTKRRRVWHTAVRPQFDDTRKIPGKTDNLPRCLHLYRGSGLVVFTRLCGANGYGRTRLFVVVGRAVRCLPKEAEWKSAWRGGSAAACSIVDDFCGPASQAWFDADSGRKPQSAGGNQPTTCGQYDMRLNNVRGNVWKWCSDWCSGKYYAGSPRTDAQGPKSGSLRGLAWRIEGRRIGIGPVCKPVWLCPGGHSRRGWFL